MFGISTMQVKKSLLLTLVWMLFASFFIQKPFWSFRPDLHDHISNLHSTVALWHRGIEIYNKPVQEMLERDTSEIAEKIAQEWKWPKEELFVLPERSNSKPLMIVWGGMPRPYPPGIYLILTPFALLMEYWGGFSESILILLMFLLCFTGHLVFFQSYNVIQEHLQVFGLKTQEVRTQKSLPSSLRFYLPTNNILLKLLLLSIYLDLIGWSLCGQYEVLGLFFLIPSYIALNNKQYLNSIIFFTLSFFIHYRAIIWILPFLTLWLLNYRSVITQFLSMSLIKKIGTFIVANFGIIASAIFLLISPALLKNTPLTNKFALDLLSGALSYKHFLVLFGLIFILFHYCKRRNWIFLLGLFNILILFLKANFLQPWYILYLIPLLFAFRNPMETKKSLYLRYGIIVLIGSNFLNSSPTEFYFIKKIIQTIGTRLTLY